MAFALYTQKIHCPNCSYQGKAKVKGSGAGHLILWLILFIVSFFFWPLFFVAGLYLIWIIFKPADQICPKCKWANPIPLKQYEKQRSSQQNQGMVDEPLNPGPVSFEFAGKSKFRIVLWAFIGFSVLFISLLYAMSYYKP